MNDFDDGDEALHHKDMCELERATVEALKAARTRPLTDDEAMLVAWSAGVSQTLYQEIRK